MTRTHPAHPAVRELTEGNDRLVRLLRQARAALASDPAPGPVLLRRLLMAVHVDARTKEVLVYPVARRAHPDGAALVRRHAALHRLAERHMAAAQERAAAGAAAGGDVLVVIAATLAVLRSERRVMAPLLARHARGARLDALAVDLGVDPAGPWPPNASGPPVRAA